jgi:ABC-2 type transport system ATP-binding protein
VQRVSDEVAILNHGQLIAQACIEDLLADSGQATYLVTLAGKPAQAIAEAQAEVAAQPWVTALTAQTANGATLWQVAVNDEDAAETNLLPLVLAAGPLRVKEFRRRQYNLEEVFLQLVEGGNHGR